ncbi:glutamyl-tRNA reductase [Clostridium sartagoforme]|uniref:Glutamyl-tRNA reductase n=1 Tax=Clostridium sartagoforme TaxID=84031 RepID=A0A4V3RLH0_9CLOT|nr:glutamyl-tRNA reductase [Clostridium sartagoforme]TGY43690.1 glutamyl-tRNA reductase [Clostridium sartagoforme]
MIVLLGIKKNTSVEIREKLSLAPKKRKEYLVELNKYFEEVVILSTCNRTEIYINSKFASSKAQEMIFNIFKWDIDLMENCFSLEEDKAVRHLMEVVCGFHSKILGEDQILGQIKEAYNMSMEYGTVTHELQRLFQEAITCGKKFRTEGKLYEIPVSSASIAVNKAIKNNAKDIMIIGYGEVGSLALKYALSNNVNFIALVVRKPENINDIKDSRVKVMTYDEGRDIINNMDAVISCTSAPHLIIEKKHIKNEGENLIIFDLALPRDVEESIGTISRVRLYDIDEISSMDDENKELRKERMIENKKIIDDYVEEYLTWKSLRGISGIIKEFKNEENRVIKEREITLNNKFNDERQIEIAKMLIKSTSDYYVNRAIKVLKEEELKGHGEECARILEKIFLEKI